MSDTVYVADLGLAVDVGDYRPPNSPRSPNPPRNLAADAGTNALNHDLSVNGARGTAGDSVTGAPGAGAGGGPGAGPERETGAGTEREQEPGEEAELGSDGGIG